MIVTSSVPGATTSPRLAGRALTMPANGAFTLVSSICCQTDIWRAFAAASCASAIDDRVARLLEIAGGERAALDERLGALVFGPRDGECRFGRGHRRLSTTRTTTRDRARRSSRRARQPERPVRDRPAARRDCRRPARGRWLRARPSAARRPTARPPSHRSSRSPRSPVRAARRGGRRTLGRGASAAAAAAAVTRRGRPATHAPRRMKPDSIETSRLLRARSAVIERRPEDSAEERRARERPARRARPRRDWPAPPASDSRESDSSSCVDRPSRFLSSAIWYARSACSTVPALASRAASAADRSSSAVAESSSDHSRAC